MNIFYISVPTLNDSQNLAWAGELNQCFLEKFTSFDEAVSNGYYPRQDDVLLFGWGVGVSDFILKKYLWNDKQTIPKIATIIHSLTNWRNDNLTSKLKNIMEFKDIEMLSVPDLLIFPTNYLREKVLNLFSRLNKIERHSVVTGLPMYKREPEMSKKKNILVFNQRISQERRFDLFAQFATVWLKKKPNWKVRFLLKIPIGLDFAKYDSLYSKAEIIIPKSRDDYFSYLEECRLTVSFCTIETFGYSILEAIQMGVKALVPRAGAYPELIENPNNFYSTEEINNIPLLVDKATVLLNTPNNKHSIDRFSKDFIMEKIGRIIGGYYA